jgi:hypothetical protein
MAWFPSASCLETQSLCCNVRHRCAAVRVRSVVQVVLTVATVKQKRVVVDLGRRERKGVGGWVDVGGFDSVTWVPFGLSD